MPYRMLVNPFMTSGFTPITFVASATSALATIVIPATAQAGDVAILFDGAHNDAAQSVTDVIPTGWTGIVTDFVVTGGSSGARGRISYKILAAGEEGDTITGMNTSTEDKVMFVFRAGSPIVAVSAEDWVMDAIVTDPAAQTVNASTLGTAPLIVFGMSYEDNATAAFTTASPAFDATVANADGNIIAGYKIYNS